MYVIAEGLGGLGQGITRWMSQRGARNFILLSRSGATELFAKKLNADIAIFDILGSLSIAQIGLLAAKRSSYKQNSWVVTIS